MGPVRIGVRPGQARTAPALAVVEAEWRRTGVGGREREEDYYLVRHLERLTTGVAHTAIAERLSAVVMGLRDRAERERGTRSIGAEAYVDATGLGAPIVDLLRARGDVMLTPVYLTGGDKYSAAPGDATILGKAHLVARLQILLQTGRVLLPQTEEARVLAEELMDYEITLEPGADERGPFSVGAHDALVTALGLAVHRPAVRASIIY